MKELAGPVQGRAAAADQLIERALVERARKVERLTVKRRKVRKHLAAIERELRIEKRFLRGMVADSADHRKDMEADRTGGRVKRGRSLL